MRVAVRGGSVGRKSLADEISTRVTGGLGLEGTWSPESALNAAAVSGVGTGPEPAGWGAQSPSRFTRVSSLFSRGVSEVTSKGAETKTGSGAASTPAMSINWGAGAGAAAAIATRAETTQAERIVAGRWTLIA